MAVPEEYTAFSERVSDLFKRAVEVAELSLNDTQTGTKISGELLPMLLQEMRRAVEDSRTVELSAPMQFEKDAQGLIFGTVNATTDHEVLYTTTDVAYDAIAVAYTAIAAAVVAVVGIAVVFVGSEQTPAASLSGKHLNYDAFHRLARILATNAHRVEPRQVH
ncbi:hypothetical protein ASC98_24395 [Rhizobacter sp. Root1238]|nr:hypothetical protein ASC88_27860 [Rhizobacter sp. Root29]KQW08897.1 hypothetical protein ASC98_24395 [Rhizobacter sp. Root1238]